MGDSVHFVKSIPPRAFSISKKYLAGMLQIKSGLALPFANVANCDGKIIFAKEI